MCPEVKARGRNDEAGSRGIEAERLAMINIDKVKQFIADARQELRKVTWPTKQQTMTSTWVVLAVTVVISVFLGLVDLAFSKIIGFILK